MIAIGGWGLSTNIESMVTSSSDREKFVDSVYDFVKKYNFDGITFDWSRTAWPTDGFDDYVKLLESLHTAFDGKYTLGITVAARPVNFKPDKVDK